MSFKHRVYVETPEMERLASLAAEIAAPLAELSYVPRVHFFVEDEAGSFERD